MLSCNDLSYLASCDETTKMINYCEIQSEALDTKKDSNSIIGFADQKTALKCMKSEVEVD